MSLADLLMSSSAEYSDPPKTPVVSHDDDDDDSLEQIEREASERRAFQRDADIEWMEGRRDSGR